MTHRQLLAACDLELNELRKENERLRSIDDKRSIDDLYATREQMLTILDALDRTVTYFSTLEDTETALRCLSSPAPRSALSQKVRKAADLVDDIIGSPVLP